LSGAERIYVKIFSAPIFRKISLRGRCRELMITCNPAIQTRLVMTINMKSLTKAYGANGHARSGNVQLFERKARGVILTSAGRQYLPYISEALSMIATGTLRLPRRRFEDKLSISASVLFTYQFLLPRLHKFREMYPNIVVTVDASPRIVQLPSDQFDLAIRSGRDAWPNLSCDLLGRVSLVPVGAPGYVRELSRGGSLDWSRATQIQTSRFANANWSEWELCSTYPSLEDWCWELRDWHWKPRPKGLELQWAVCR